jgi:organic hydroperoxide reductase OsmC/OhrA
MAEEVPATRTHRYAATIEWTGNPGPGTTGYRSYSRDHVIRVAGKPELAGSSDPAFRGDPARHSPEDLLVAALSACHMLWYLHLCAVNGIVVTGYVDAAEGTMEDRGDAGGRFADVTLRPRVRISDGDPEKARKLHSEAHERCFVANSVNFPVRIDARVEVGSSSGSPTSRPRA